MRRIFIAMICLVALANAVGGAQPASFRHGPLPAPSGTFRIGRVTLHWTDSARLEPLAASLRNRELVVDIWYPAEPRTGPAAQYIDSAAFDHAFGITALRSLLGSTANDLVRSGGVPTHAVEGAPFAH